MKKQIAAALAVLITLSCAVGCGTKKSSGSETTLKWTMVGPSGQKDAQKVFDELNRKLKTYEGFENINLNISIIEGSDYKQKFQLWQTSGEELDIVQTYGLNYGELARDGSFVSLNDYIDKSKELKNEFPEYVWNYAVVDGEKYYVPSYQLLANVDYSFVTPKALADKYMDIEKIQSVMNSAEIFDDSCWDAIEEYLDTLAANNELKMGYKPLDSLTFTLQKGYVDAGNRMIMRKDDPTHTLYYMDEVPDRFNDFKRLSQLYKKGYVRSDIASVDSSDNMIGAENGYTLWHEGFRADEELNKNQNDNLEKKYGFAVEEIMTKDYEALPKENAAGGLAISSLSKHPDEAFKVIELFTTEKGKDLYRLLAYGIEGEHYKLLGDDVIEPIGYVGQASSTSNYGLYAWNTGNMKYSFNKEGEKLNGDRLDELNSNEKLFVSPLTGFVPDTSAITSEIAQINTVFEEYKDLNCGNRPNVEATYNEYMNKVRTAGMEKVKAEMQKQVDEFFANKK